MKLSSPSDKIEGRMAITRHREAQWIYITQHVEEQTGSFSYVANHRNADLSESSHKADPKSHHPECGAIAKTREASTRLIANGRERLNKLLAKSDGYTRPWLLSVCEAQSHA